MRCKVRKYSPEDRVRKKLNAASGTAVVRELSPEFLDSGVEAGEFLRRLRARPDAA